MNELNFEEIKKLYEDKDIVEDDIKKDTEDINDLDDSHEEPKDDTENKLMSQEEFVEKWNLIKNNNVAIFKEFNALQRDKRLRAYASKNSKLNKTFRIVGMSLVGLSSLIGGAFKFLNFLIPGADVITSPLARLLSPVRVGGQALVNANSKLKVPKRIAPSTKNNSRY